MELEVLGLAQVLAPKSPAMDPGSPLPPDRVLLDIQGGQFVISVYLTKQLFLGPEFSCWEMNQ